MGQDYAKAVRSGSYNWAPTPGGQRVAHHEAAEEVQAGRDHEGRGPAAPYHAQRLSVSPEAREERRTSLETLPGSRAGKPADRHSNRRKEKLWLLSVGLEATVPWSKRECLVIDLLSHSWLKTALSNTNVDPFGESAAKDAVRALDSLISIYKQNLLEKLVL